MAVTALTAVNSTHNAKVAILARCTNQFLPTSHFMTRPASKQPAPATR